MHIMLVNDAEHLIEGMREVLELDDHTTICFTDSAEAMAYIEAIDTDNMPNVILPEVAILNYMMPRYCGDALARRIRQSALLGHIPLILESVSIPKSDTDKCRRLFEEDGFTVMLHSPLAAEDLLNAVEHAMKPEQPADYKERIF